MDRIWYATLNRYNLSFTNPIIMVLDFLENLTKFEQLFYKYLELILPLTRSHMAHKAMLSGFGQKLLQYFKQL
jgi:hypothetical protein